MAESNTWYRMSSRYTGPEENSCANTCPSIGVGAGATFIKCVILGLSTLQSKENVSSNCDATGPSILTIASTHSPTPESCLKVRGSTRFMLPVHTIALSITKIFRWSLKSARRNWKRPIWIGNASVTWIPAFLKRFGQLDLNQSLLPRESSNTLQATPRLAAAIKASPTRSASPPKAQI